MLTAVDKMNVRKYLNKHAVGDIYYLDLCDALAKRGKIKDVEFLEYFVGCIITEFEKDSKLQMKYVIKLTSVINSFLGWIHEENSEIEVELLDRIRNLENYYDDYLNRTNYDIDLDYTENYLTPLMELITELYPTQKESNESLVDYLKEIDELRKKVGNLIKQLEQLQNNYDYLKNQFDDKSKSLVLRNEELGRANGNIEKLNAYIKKIEERILELTGNIEDLGIELDSSKNTIESLIPFKEECERLNKMVAELTQIIQRYENDEKEKKEKKITELIIENFIYENLLNQSLSIDDLLILMKKSGFNASREDAYNILKGLKQRVNVVSNSFSLSPEYKIVKPTVLENGLFNLNLPEGCKYYDILLLSDFHIDSLIYDKLVSGMDRVYEYCVKNGIKMIMNLGDFFHAKFSRNTPYEEALANYSCVEKAISIIPRADGIYHAVLGGNHDKKVLRYGFDPIELLATEREDFINLGYTSSVVTFDGSISTLSSFGIHHPSSFDFDIDLDDDGLDTSTMISDLDKFYQSIGYTRNDSYVDVLGHTHRSLINNPDSYVFVPSYFGKNKGATHLRIYFDEDTKIKYTVFMPLLVSDKLKKSTEIIYQKTLIKK